MSGRRKAADGFEAAFRNDATRANETRMTHHARATDITAYANQALANIDNARNKPEDEKRAELAKIKTDITRRKLHTTGVDNFLSMHGKLVGTLYADQILTDARVASVKHGDEDAAAAKQYLTEMEKYPEQVTKARTKIEGLLKQLG